MKKGFLSPKWRGRRNGVKEKQCALADDLAKGNNNVDEATTIKVATHSGSNTVDATSVPNVVKDYVHNVQYVLDSGSNKMLNDEPSRKTVNFRTLLAPIGNKADIAISMESIRVVHERLIVVPKFMGEGYTMSTIRVQYKWTPPRCSSCKVFGHVLDECPKKIISYVLKNPRQVGYEWGNSKLGKKGVNSDVVYSAHGTSSKASGCSYTTLLEARINDLERKMMDVKLVLVNDYGKPLKSSKVNKSSKSGSGVGNKCLCEKYKEAYNEDPYDDNDFNDCGLTDAQIKFVNSFDISLRGQLR
ncbi:hypothetical protein Tco_0488378 [Tanacetum coccineum]